MSASRKVEDGKLVEVRVGDNIQVLGDFFMHPEERIGDLEKVVAESIEEDADVIQDNVERFLREEEIELLGVDERDLAEVAVEARKRRDEDDEDEV